MAKWAKHVNSGFYYKLLETSKLKPEDMEPDIGVLSFYVDVFRELSTCRQSGMGVGPIPFTAVVEYFRLFDTGMSLDDFLFIIRVMDNAYLDFEDKKLSKERPSGGKPTTKANNNKGPVKR